MSLRLKILKALLGAAAVAMLATGPGALAQPATPASVLPTGGGLALIDTSDSVFLLLDHQSGLFQTVKDVSVTELRNNTVMLAKLATLLKIPVITTASEPNGPNGPLMPEIHQFAPHAVYVGRKGEVNAWDNEDFVKAVRATGKKTLIMAGVWTSVCVMFPALDAKAVGFKVYAVMDASGDPSELASRTTLARFSRPTSTNAVLSETHRTWNRPEAADLAKLSPSCAELRGCDRELSKGSGGCQAAEVSGLFSGLSAGETFPRGCTCAGPCPLRGQTLPSQRWSWTSAFPVQRSKADRQFAASSGRYKNRNGTLGARRLRTYSSRRHRSGHPGVRATTTTPCSSWVKVRNPAYEQRYPTRSTSSARAAITGSSQQQGLCRP